MTIKKEHVRKKIISGYKADLSSVPSPEDVKELNSIIAHEVAHKLLREEHLFTVSREAAEQLLDGRLSVDDMVPETKQPEPPYAKVADGLITLFFPSERTDAILGDLEEKFVRNVEAVGEKRARWRFWSEIVRSCGAVLFAKLRTWGVIAALVDLGRRKIGG
jgi:hypothetical protein